MNSDRVPHVGATILRQVIAMIAEEAGAFVQDAQSIAESKGGVATDFAGAACGKSE